MRLQSALKEAGTCPAKDIAKKYGIDYAYLRTAASRKGISLAFILPNIKKKSWTQAEEKYLRANSVIKTAEQIANDLGRTEASVKSKASKLGVLLQKFGENHQSAKYSNTDIELCRQLHDLSVSPSNIAEKMEVELSYIHQVLSYRVRFND